MSRLLGAAMQWAVQHIDTSAKQAEGIVWQARLEVEALEAEYTARLVRAAERARHSDDITAIRTCRDQLYEAAVAMSELPDMNYLDPESVPAMTIAEVRELLNDVKLVACHMQERYHEVIQKPSRIVLA